MARQSWLSRFSPASAWDNATARPGQTALRTGLGILGSALGGPVVGQAVSRGVGAWQDRRNDQQFDRGAAQLMQSGIENNNAAIWGSPGASTGQPSAYQPLLPNSPSYGVQSPLLASLGIPNYTSPQPAATGLPGIASPLAGSGYGPSISSPSGFAGNAGASWGAASSGNGGAMLYGGTGFAPQGFGGGWDRMTALIER